MVQNLVPVVHFTADLTSIIGSLYLFQSAHYTDYVIELFPLHISLHTDYHMGNRDNLFFINIMRTGLYNAFLICKTFTIIIFNPFALKYLFLSDKQVYNYGSGKIMVLVTYLPHNKRGYVGFFQYLTKAIIFFFYQSQLFELHKQSNAWNTRHEASVYPRGCSIRSNWTWL